MTLSVHQHWDPLKTCVVGRSYPPEFYHWITVPRVRNLFEKIAIETEEDYQKIIDLLESFGVTVLRPDLENLDLLHAVKTPYPYPPMNPRDQMVMIGEKFYHRIQTLQWWYDDIKDPSWPAECKTMDQFHQLPQYIQDECLNIHQMPITLFRYDKIFEWIKQQGNEIIATSNHYSVGAQVSRIGKDLYFGTNTDTNSRHYSKVVKEAFPSYRTHIVNTLGHGDGTYCPVCPGLIISLYDIKNYQETFPDWEVIYLPNQSWNKIKPFLELKNKNAGKYWIPGWEHDQAVIDTVSTWLDHWLGYVEETVFDVNMLIVDPKNVIVFNHNDKVFEALQRYGITPHVIPFRHRYFWDGGIHCVTSDLDRAGSMQDFFPNRS